MDFGLFDWIENRPIPRAQHYEERLRFLEEADRAGFFCYHLAEHQPYPPLWYPTHNPASIRMAGVRGFNLVTALPNRILRDLISAYRDNWTAHRGDADRLNPQVAAPRIAVSKLAFLAETDREAHEGARAAHAVWWSSLTWLARRSHVDLPGIAAMGDYDRAAGSGGILIGSPATVAAQVAELAETGINYLICAFQWGSLTHAEAMSSMRLFVREIMPRFGTGAPADG